MSIVEKALSKLQDAHKGSHAPPQQPPTPVRSPVSVTPTESIPIAAVNERSEFVVRNKIDVDPAALRAAGLLPPEKDGLALRNHFRRLKWPILDGITKRRSEGQSLAGVLMIASAVPGEGKTFVSCNLALSIAREESSRVILIDGDIAKSHLTDAFRLREKPGLTDYLSNPSLSYADVLYATSFERLFVIPSGRFVQHASELLSGVRMQQLLNSLVAKQSGHVVVLDTSPVLATNEAQVLSRVVSQILLVVRADSTPQPTVQEACNLLGPEKLSAVLNQANTSLGDSYNAQYGTYGTYGNESKQ